MDCLINFCAAVLFLLLAAIPAYAIYQGLYILRMFARIIFRTEDSVHLYYPYLPVGFFCVVFGGLGIQSVWYLLCSEVEQNC